MVERHGLTLTQTQHDELVKQIQTGRATFIERQSNRVTLWSIQHSGTEVRVVYDRNTKNIVTALPTEEWDAWVKGQRKL